MKRAATLVLTLLAVTPATALMQAFGVEPVKASWSGRVKHDVGVGQGITCNFDLPVYAEFFTGTATNAQYQVQLKFPGEDGLVVAHGDTAIAGDHKWIRCYFEVIYPDSIIKGRVYEVRWTLSGGSDSLVYYYDSTDAYQWGSIVLPGQSAPVNDPRDLAMRVYGQMDTIGANWFGTNPSFLLLSFV